MLKDNVLAIEGIDGCGKSTQVQRLADYYTEQGLKVKVQVFPSRDTEVGKLVRELMKSSKAHTKEGRLAIQYLMETDRLLTIPHIQEWREDYDLVLFDRYSVSNLAYGVADGFSLRFVAGLQKYPKIETVMIDITPQLGIQRRKGKIESVYDTDVAFLTKVRELYTSLIPISNRISGIGDEETVTKQLITWIDVNIFDNKRVII